MSLENWLNDKLIVRHRLSAGEIAELLHICDRDLEKAQIAELGPDWRLSIAHNAAVQAAKVALAVAGYRAQKEGQHYLVLQSLAFTIKTDPLQLSSWTSSVKNVISAIMKKLDWSLNKKPKR